MKDLKFGAAATARQDFEPTPMERARHATYAVSPTLVLKSSRYLTHDLPVEDQRGGYHVYDGGTCVYTTDSWQQIEEWAHAESR